MTDIVKLVTEGEVQVNDRTFTRLVGGFGEDNPIITTKQISNLLELDNRVVNQTINRNIDSFVNGLDIIDLKTAVTESDSEMLNEINYTQNAYNASKNVYILSKAGFLLYLKFAEGDKSVEVYKAFIEDYFKTKAENKVMKSAIENQMDILKQEKKDLYGELIVAENELERATFLMKLEEKNKQITSLQSSLDQEKLIEKLQPKLKASELIENSKSSYDIGTFAKVLAVKELGRTNLFKWLKQKKFLRANREPYQQYMDYFSVKYVPNQNGVMYPKTLIKPKGVLFIIKYLIKDGIVLTKTNEEILSELETSIKVV